MKKLAIVGTAPSWHLTPWNDPDLAIWSLNDAYNINGFQRADEWYDFHPLNKLHFAPPIQDGQRQILYAHSIPAGHYVRPAKHLDWLATQTMPIWLHPDYATQLPAAATWPMARAFPKAEIEAHFGQYFTSSPAWMLAHAILRGYREIHIYGIHLSTESEYIEQRPGFEFLIGRVLGPGKLTTTTAGGLRRYATEDGVIVLPELSPVLAAKFQYAFQPSKRGALEPLKWELHKAQVKQQRTIEALKTANLLMPWTKVTEPIPDDPDGLTSSRWVRTSSLQRELWHYDALVADCQDQLARAQVGL